MRLSTEPARQPDKINLDVNVQEGNTASFQVGGGYDSASSLFGTFLLQNTNLFGGGESASFSAEIGFLFQNYNVSYTEPWFLDMPLAVSLQGFDNKLYLFSFDQSEIGFLINSGYPLADLGLRKLGPFSLEHVTAGLGYQFESVGISDLSPFTTFDIQNAQGLPAESRSSCPRSAASRSTTRATRAAVRSRASTWNSPGWAAHRSSRASCTAAGSFRSSRVRGLANGFTRPRSRYGIGTALETGNGGELPLYERFFPGGLNGQGQVRGYEIYSLGPQVTLFNQFRAAVRSRAGGRQQGVAA